MSHSIPSSLSTPEKFGFPQDAAAKATSGVSPKNVALDPSTLAFIIEHNPFLQEDEAARRSGQPAKRGFVPQLPPPRLSFPPSEKDMASLEQMLTRLHMAMSEQSKNGIETATEAIESNKQTIEQKNKEVLANIQKSIDELAKAESLSPWEKIFGAFKIITSIVLAGAAIAATGGVAVPAIIGTLAALDTVITVDQTFNEGGVLNSVMGDDEKAAMWFSLSVSLASNLTSMGGIATMAKSHQMSATISRVVNANMFVDGTSQAGQAVVDMTVAGYEKDARLYEKDAEQARVDKEVASQMIEAWINNVVKEFFKNIDEMSKIVSDLVEQTSAGAKQTVIKNIARAA